GPHDPPGAARRRARCLRDVPEEGGRLHQGRPEGVTASGAPVAPVVMVTGATGGIGAATVREYARRGARLVLLARSAGLLEALREEVAGLGTEALVTVADVADAAAVDAAFATATKRFGRVDVVV